MSNEDSFPDSAEDPKWLADRKAKEKEEFAWLIEFIGSPPAYWDGRGPDTFSIQHFEAVRFSRREDADKVLHWIIKRELVAKCKPVEHGWA